MAAGALWGLVAALETHRGRDRAVRALSYGCQLAGAALPGPAGLPGGLLAASAQLSSCRTALRLFDDLAMLRHSCSYGLGPEGEDALVRGLSVLCNVANQLYYPCEHLAWAADVGIVRAGSRQWWARSTALWGCALLLGILRSLRILCQLRRKLSQHKCTSSPQQQQQLRAQVKAEVLSILMDTADLSNAIHWLPPGFLWAGKFPPWLISHNQDWNPDACCRGDCLQLIIFITLHQRNNSGESSENQESPTMGKTVGERFASICPKR